MSKTTAQPLARVLTFLFHHGAVAARSAAVGSTSKPYFEGKLVYFYLPAWEFGACHCYQVANCAGTASKPECKDAGDGRQRPAGDSGCRVTFSSFWPPRHRMRDSENPGSEGTARIIWSNLLGKSDDMSCCPQGWAGGMICRSYI